MPVFNVPARCDLPRWEYSWECECALRLVVQPLSTGGYVAHSSTWVGTHEHLDERSSAAEALRTSDWTRVWLAVGSREGPRQMLRQGSCDGRQLRVISHRSLTDICCALDGLECWIMKIYATYWLLCFYALSLSPFCLIIAILARQLLYYAPCEFTTLIYYTTLFSYAAYRRSCVGTQTVRQKPPWALTDRWTERNLKKDTARVNQQYESLSWRNTQPELWPGSCRQAQGYREKLRELVVCAARLENLADITRPALLARQNGWKNGRKFRLFGWVLSCCILLRW